MKKEISIWLNDIVLYELDQKGKMLNMTRTEYIEYILSFPIVRMERAINGHKFYPIHLTDDEIHELLNEFIVRHSRSGILEVMINKTHGGKGVNFEVNYYFVDKENNKCKDRRYSFSLDPNWEINDFFDHWIPDIEEHEKSPSTIVSCEKIKEYTLESIQKIIINRLENNTNQPLIQNPIFNSKNRKLIIEQNSICYLDI